MRRSLQRVGGDKIVGFQELAAHIRSKEDDEREHEQEHHCADDVFNRVIRMERNSVEWNAGFGILVLLYFDAVRIVRPHLMQRNQMRHH